MAFLLAQENVEQTLVELNLPIKIQVQLYPLL